MRQLNRLGLERIVSAAKKYALPGRAIDYFERALPHLEVGRKPQRIDCPAELAEHRFAQGRGYLAIDDCVSERVAQHTLQDFERQKA